MDDNILREIEELEKKKKLKVERLYAGLWMAKAVARVVIKSDFVAVSGF